MTTPLDSLLCELVHPDSARRLSSDIQAHINRRVKGNHDKFAELQLSEIETLASAFIKDTRLVEEYPWFEDPRNPQMGEGSSPETLQYYGQCVTKIIQQKVKHKRVNLYKLQSTSSQVQPSHIARSSNPAAALHGFITPISADPNQAPNDPQSGREVDKSRNRNTRHRQERILASLTEITHDEFGHVPEEYRHQLHGKIPQLLLQLYRRLGAPMMDCSNLWHGPCAVLRRHCKNEGKLCKKAIENTTTEVFSPVDPAERRYSTQFQTQYTSTTSGVIANSPSVGKASASDVTDGPSLSMKRDRSSSSDCPRPPQRRRMMTSDTESDVEFLMMHESITATASRTPIRAMAASRNTNITDGPPQIDQNESARGTGDNPRCITPEGGMTDRQSVSANSEQPPDHDRDGKFRTDGTTQTESQRWNYQDSATGIQKDLPAKILSTDSDVQTTTSLANPRALLLPQVDVATTAAQTELTGPMIQDLIDMRTAYNRVPVIQIVRGRTGAWKGLSNQHAGGLAQQYGQVAGHDDAAQESLEQKLCVAMKDTGFWKRVEKEGIIILRVNDSAGDEDERRFAVLSGEAQPQTG